MKILCLEQGDWVKPTDYPSNGRDWEARGNDDFSYSPNRRGRVTDYPINEDASPIKIANFNGVGGGTILYAGHFPRFHPSDFRVRSLDGVGDDWPIDYKMLEPYYAENARMMGISGLAGDPAYPPKQPMMPPLPLGKSGTALARGLNRLGWHWSRRRITKAAPNASISATASAAARKGRRRAPTSPTGRRRSAPASNCARAAGCARLRSMRRAWPPAWFISTPTGPNISSPRRWSLSPATASARRGFC
jgi:choline dehydrogenase-like flavoprotein